MKTYLGNGNGTFLAGVTTNTNGNTVYLGQTADLNNDGHSDFIGVSSFAGSGYVTFGLGQTSGTFTSITTIANGGVVDSIVTGDFNRDGNIDFVTNSNTTGTQIFIGNGDGTFAARRTLIAANGVGLTATDFNGDGNLDLITNSGVFFGNGDGTFSGVLTAIGSSSPIIAGDINGDGALDLVSSANNQFYLQSFISNTTKTTSAEFVNLYNQQDARSALGILSNRLQRISDELGTIGSFQSRLTVASNVLQTTRENYSAANSRIVDADIAQESASLASTKIVQQAAASVLAQANQQPALALQLLRG